MTNLLIGMFQNCVCDSFMILHTATEIRTL